jgi:Flp pilus assembly protein TadG
MIRLFVPGAAIVLLPASFLPMNISVVSGKRNRREESNQLKASPARNVAREAAEMRLKQYSRSAHNEEGQAMVEVALVLPLLLLVLTGIFAFGLAFNNYILLTEATTIGARTLAISRGATTDPCATASSAVIAAAPLLTPANLTFSFSLNGVSYTGTSCSSGSSTTGAAANLVQGANAMVTVTYPCSLVVYGGNYAPQCSLQAKMTELIQ